jgi:hypothetical protein
VKWVPLSPFLKGPSKQDLAWILAMLLSKLLNGIVIVLLGSNQWTKRHQLDTSIFRGFDVTGRLTPGVKLYFPSELAESVRA